MKKFSEIRRPMTPERRVRIDAIKGAIDDAVNLAELRAAREVTQVQLAAKLRVNQSSVSGIERRGDAYLSTLEDYVAGLGGRLKISAVFPEGETVIRMSSGDRNPGIRSWAAKTVSNSPPKTVRNSPPKTSR